MVAGLALRPHWPPAAGWTAFFTLEGKTRMAQVTVVPEVYDWFGALVCSSAALIFSGTVQKRGDGTYQN